jgi:hypothetical protein
VGVRVPPFAPVLQLLRRVAQSTTVYAAVFRLPVSSLSNNPTTRAFAGRQGGMLGREVLRVLVADFVRGLRGPIALANHVRTINVRLRRAGLGAVLSLHKRDKIILEERR